MKSTNASSKYVSVRITTSQKQQLEKMGEPFGTSVNALVQMGVANLLNDEGPIWADAAKSIRSKTKK